MALLRNIMLWLVAIAAIPISLGLLGLPEKLATGAGFGLAFGLIAHISSSAEWKAIRSKYLFDGETWNSTSLSRDVDNPSRFDTSVQRVWLLVGGTGLGLALASYGMFVLHGPYDNFVEAVLGRPYSAWAFKIPFLLGCALAACGCFFAFFHAVTLGRLARWVKTGLT